jgi:hypothetical protein
MRDARYVRLISWTLQSGSEHWVIFKVDKELSVLNRQKISKTIFKKAFWYILNYFLRKLCVNILSNWPSESENFCLALGHVEYETNWEFNFKKWNTSHWQNFLRKGKNMKRNKRDLAKLFTSKTVFSFNFFGGIVSQKHIYLLISAQNSCFLIYPLFTGKFFASQKGQF